MTFYAKFMKDLVIRKQTVSYEPTDNVHHCNVVASRSFVEKKEDLEAFTIPCTICFFNFTQVLYDLVASINLKLLIVFKQLGLGALKLTSMRLLMVDRTLNKIVGIICDVLVKVKSFLYPVDFLILDC